MIDETDFTQMPIANEVDLMRCVSSDYVIARHKFLVEARALGCAITSYEHPLSRLDVPLFTDVAVLNSVDSAPALALSSGVHGVEGFCGSAMQLAWMRSGCAMQSQRRGITQIFIHAVNPWGFSHLRRVNEDNVDVNRNFGDFKHPRQIRDTANSRLQAILSPTRRNSNWLSLILYMFAFAAQHSFQKLQQIIHGGQSEYPANLFFTGTAPTWSRLTWARICSEHLAKHPHLVVVDFHTGLGRFGDCTLLCPFSRESRHADFLMSLLPHEKFVYVNEGQVSSSNAKSDVVVSCDILRFTLSKMVGASSTALFLEFGTKSKLSVLKSLLVENAATHLYPEDQKLQTARQALKHAFVSDEPEWWNRVYQMTHKHLSSIVSELAISAN